MDNTEWEGVTFLLLQTTIAKCLEKLTKRTFSAHELPALPSNIIWVGLSVKKNINRCKKVSSEMKKKEKKTHQKNPNHPDMLRWH